MTFLHHGDKRKHAQLAMRQMLDGEGEALREDGQEGRAEDRALQRANAVDR